MFFSFACFFAIFIFSLTKSIPVTFPPSLAIGSHINPPPQPTSKKSRFLMAKKIINSYLT